MEVSQEARDEVGAESKRQSLSQKKLASILLIFGISKLRDGSLTLNEPTIEEAE